MILKKVRVASILFLVFLAYNLEYGVATSDICSSEICDCEDTVADCRRRTLTTVAEKLVIPSYIWKVDFSDNALESLNIEAVSHPLNCLDLSSNSLTELSNKTFEAFNETVKILYLKNNGIRDLHNETFLKLSSLTKLDLSFNEITSLPDGLFDSLVHLQHLDLSFNPMKTIRGTTFMNLAQLQDLNLSFLQLTLLHPSVFDWDLGITSLDLSYNYFTSVPNKALWYLRNTLQTLHFSGNLLQEISTGSFLELFHLRSLKMEQMLHLRIIESHAFDDLHSLETLELRYLPKIRGIHPKAFQLSNHSNDTTLTRCPIRDLTIQFSTLSSLPENLLQWDHLRYAALRNNRWICDCNVKWMKGSPLEELTGSSIYCWAPLKNRGKTLKQLNEENLTCTTFDLNTEGGAVAVLMIVVLGLIISFVTVILLVYRRNGWVFNPPRLQYDKVDSPLNSITIYDRSSISSNGDREMVFIHD